MANYSRVTGLTLYLTPGNFPSVAANSIQVAKMATAYKRWLPELEVVALSGLLSMRKNHTLDLNLMYGLSRPLAMRYLPFLLCQKEPLFDQDYRPPRWFYRVVGQYARFCGAKLVFTRKPETAWETVRGGIDTILESHDPFGEGEWQRVPKRILTHSNLRGLVVISESLADSYVSAGIRPPSLVVAPDGVDVTQFNPPVDRDEARRRLGLELGGFTCVYSGHLYPGRGIEEILEVSKALPQIRFLFAGGWPRDVAHWRSITRSKNLENVMFCGYVPQAEIPLYLFASDVLLMPYSSTLQTVDRCSPLKMFEYLASGRPIISSDLPVLRSVLHHKENALLIPPDSVSELIAAICRLQKDTELGERLGSNGRRDSVQYSWDERAKRILDVSLGRD